MKNAYFKITSWSISINGTSSNLQSNTWMSIEDLLYGLMLPSGNDSALVLAQNLGAVLYFDKTGNKELIQCTYYDNLAIKSIDLTEDLDSIKYYMAEFINFMNEKTKMLKMTKTKFANPHGLDNVNNYSCCEDVLIMCREAMSSQLISKIVSTTKYKGTFKTFKDKKIICKTILWTNTNKLLERNSNVVGIKTGITPKAGGCLATYVKLDEQNYAYIIVLGASSTQARFKDTQIILEYITDQNNIF